MNENYWGVKNNTSLPELNEASLVRNLRERYQKAYQPGKGDEEGGSGIYTWTGTVLLAVNPYQRLNVYGDSQMEQHFSKTITQADPHPFGIASHAFQTLNKTKAAQSIVVSGESGAGKTETAKFVMRFLSTIGRSGSGDTLASFLESTNPILEAYGNAKTCRNENSSRFGKVMKLFYSQTGPASHKLVSAAVETYLLARSRVTHTPANERNYHVFYLLTNGGLETHFSELTSIVKPAGFFSYLAGSAQVQSGYLSDPAFLKELLSAFASLGVSREDQLHLFELVLALLWLGNVTIEADEAKDSSGKCRVSPTSREAVETATRIFQVPSGSENEVSLEKLLTEQKLSIGTNNKSNSSIWAGTSASKARTVRDAVVRRVYSKIFDYIVSLLNVKLASYVTTSTTLTAIDEERFISILDIFGFENLPSNGLEQLCINYANERLQNFFLKNVVISEAEEYSRECVSYPGVSPPDNGPVIRAVAGRNGIFELLKKSTIDCMLRPLEGRDYDSDFYQTLLSASSGGSIVKATTSGGKGKNNPLINTFVVAHYAEPVQYLVEGFVDSNKDSDARVDFILSHFHNPLLQACLAVPVPGEAGAQQQQQRRCIATTFSAQVDHLLEDHLEKTRLHCIRCLKPNDSKKANCFQDERVANQLRVSGMFEVLTLMAHSYPVRIPYQDLFNRYKPLLNEKILTELSRQAGFSLGGKVHGAMARLFVQETIGFLANGEGKISEGEDFQFGTSKVFFRLGKVELLESLLAQCDSDKEFAKQVADLIGKRIMEKRKSRQLKYLRTCFKLLVIYRRRQNYWKWFHAYFVRLTFLVKVCKQHFIPQIKARRIYRNQCARTIQNVYRAHLAERRKKGKEMVNSVLKTFAVRARLCSQSKVRFQMTLASDTVQCVVQSFSVKVYLVKKLEIFLEQKRREEVETQARLAAEALENARIENERRLNELQADMVRIQAEKDSRTAELEKANLILREEFLAQISAVEAQRASEIESVEAERERRILELEKAHASEMDSLKIDMQAQLDSVRAELSERSELFDYSKQQADEERLILERAHAEELKNVKSALEEAEIDLNGKISQLMDQLDTSSKLLERTKANDQEIIDRLMAQHEADISTASEELARLRYESDSRVEKVERELAAAKQELADKEAEWEHLKQEHADEVMFARIKSKESEDYLQAKISELTVRFEETCLAHSEELEQLRRELAMEKEAELGAYEEKLVKLKETQTMLNAESAALLKERELELDSIRKKLNEVSSLKSQLENQSKADFASLEQERAKLVAGEAEKRLLLDRLIVGLRNELKSQQAEFDQSLAAKETVLKETLAQLASSKAESVSLTEQLEVVVQEKAKLAVVASQSLMQGEKLKKDAEELVKRERAEMEKKLVFETSKMKRDFEAFNQETLQVKIHEIEQIKLDTQKRFSEAEKMRADAVSIMQEIRRGHEADEKTIAVLPLEKEEVIQQAIRDYHSSNDDYERTYVIERRKDATKKERQIESARTNALEVKLQHTAVGAKIAAVARKSLGNVTNVMLPADQPQAKFPRLDAQQQLRN